MKRFALLLAVAVCLRAAERKLPPELEPVPQLALTTPPEFGADALLRLVESRRVADPDTKIALLQQAFELAGNAHFRVRMKGLAGSVADTRSGSSAKAYDLKLDALSLQARAINAMLPLNASKAREMFSSTAFSALAPLTCEDTQVYDPLPFYQALSAVASGGFTAKERAKGDHVAFLLTYVAQLRSAAQLAPMADALKSAGLSPDEREALEARFKGQMEAISGDDRSFSASVSELSAALTPAMRPSFDKYVDKNLGAKRCEENVNLTARFGGTQGAKTEPSGKSPTYWQSEAAQRLLAGAGKLRFGPAGGRPLSDAERSQPAWQAQLADYEKELADWTASSEQSEADYYHQKSIIYEALVELIPPGPDRDKALESFLGFINSFNLQRQNPVEWFVPARSMLERVRNTSNGEPAKVLSAFEASGNPVLSLYAALERLFQRNLPSWAVPTS